MGKPNIMTLHTNSLIKIVARFNEVNKKLILAIGCVTFSIFFCLVIMRSKLGLKLRAFGENRVLIAKLGLRPELYRMLGLGTSGALAALCGSIMCQTYGYSDINMGFGMAITSIGALVIGMHLISRINFLQLQLSTHNVLIELFGCFIGIFCYFSITNLLIMLEIEPTYFKLILALIMIVFLKLAIGPKTHKL
jgi:putative ABC transport system permease protein